MFNTKKIMKFYVKHIKTLEYEISLINDIAIKIMYKIFNNVIEIPIYQMHLLKGFISF